MLCSFSSRAFNAAHCVEKLRDLVHEARGLSGSEAEIVAISSRRIDDRPRALNFLGVGVADKFHLLVDESQQSFRDFGCFNGQPQHGLFLIDRNGIIRASYIGETPFSDTGEVIRRVRRTATSGGLLSPLERFSTRFRSADFLPRNGLSSHRSEVDNPVTAILFVLLTTLSAPPLNGGFIQYDDDVIQQITAKGWVQVLDQMNALGMKVVIVQFLGIPTF